MFVFALYCILQGAFGRLDPTGEAGKTMMDQIPVVGQLRYLKNVNLVQTHRTLATGANWRDRGNCKSGHLSLLRLCQVDTISLLFLFLSTKSIVAAGLMRRR